MPGPAYKTAQFLYSRLRSFKNGVANRFDDPVVVLIYHRVTTLPSDPQQLAVSPDNFRAQLRWLKEHHALVRFEEEWSGLGRPAVAITFDDGYADNALEALPIIEEVGVPATFFVATGTLGSRREFWWDELERVILGDGAFPVRFTLDARRVGASWPTASAAERGTLYGEMHRLMMEADADAREDWLAQLRRWAGVSAEGRGGHRPMTLPELHRLAASSWVTIGAHTVSHSALSALDVDAQREEVLRSKRELEAELRQKISVFSYPYGKRCSYTADSVRICREAGFVKAAANFPGQAHRWSDPFQLPRQLVRNWDPTRFAGEMKGFWT
jgi:peptidoglycan/xylan/chitin deacetylase (PgdA/CDA1 family)